VVAVPPLDVPDPRRVSDLQALAQVPAVALFVQRAQEVRPDFALTSTNAAAVAAICARLDGLPLALELAAARLTLFSPQALLARLEGASSNPPATRDPALQVLVSGARDLPERQRTLRDTLAWSYDLLAPQEQTLFRRLAVFAGGCTPEAAEAVCLLDGEERVDVLAGLIALVDHSLLRQDAVADADEARLVMLETVREYGWERLAASGEAAAVQRAHAAYYLGLAEAAAPELEGPEQAAWMARLEREHANLRAALQWTLAHSGPAEPALEGSMVERSLVEAPARAREQGARAERSALALRLAAALAPFWWLRGHLHEGRAWLDAALARADAAPVPVRAAALGWAGRLAVEQGDHAAAVALLEQSLALYRGLGDAASTARVLGSLGNVRRDRGDFGQATALYEEALALERALGRARGMARAHTNLGVVAHFRGDFREAAARHAESLRLHEQAQDAGGIALALTDLALVARDQGDYARATELGTRGLERARAVANRRGIALALLALGLSARERGEAERATELLEQSVQVCAAIAYPFGLGLGQAMLGLALQDRGQGPAAAHGDEALAVLRRIEHPWGLLLALAYRGATAAAQGERTRAAALWCEALALARRLGTTWGVPLCLEGLAGVAWGRGEPGPAALLLGVAAALRASAGAPLPPADRDRHAALVAAVRAALGEEAFTATWAEGQALSLDAAIAAACASTEIARKAHQL
jgi:predicted ATPase